MFILYNIFFFGCYKFYESNNLFNKNIQTIQIEPFFGNRFFLKDFFIMYQLTHQLRNLFKNKTILKIVNNNGDMILKGECTEYKTDLIKIKGIYKNILKIKIKITFINNKYPDKNFEHEFQASRYFNDKNTLLELESHTIILLADQLSNDIFNKICEDW